MSYTAILFMYNDVKRAEFVIEGFTKHNSDIKLIVYNGGESAKNLEQYPIEYREGPNLWGDMTRRSPGSWTYAWYEYMFNEGLKMETDNLIYLETDVQCNRKIIKDPLYDLSGPVTVCGQMCRILAYDFWEGYIVNREETSDLSFNNRPHTGMGGTSFSKNFFEKAKDNLKYVKLAEEKIPFSFYCDLMMTCLASYSGCTFGDWSEVSDTRGTLRKTNMGWYFDPYDNTKALIHNVKI